MVVHVGAGHDVTQRLAGRVIELARQNVAVRCDCTEHRAVLHRVAVADGTAPPLDDPVEKNQCAACCDCDVSVGVGGAAVDRLDRFGVEGNGRISLVKFDSRCDQTGLYGMMHCMATPESRTKPKLSVSSRNRLFLLAALLAVTVLLIAGGLAYDSQRTEAARTAVATTYVMPPDPTGPQFTLPEDPRLLILGDSYTYGANARPREQGYAFIVARELGWPSEVDGIGGTGFTWAGGPDGANRNDYISRINRRAADPNAFAPNVLLIQGGQSDHRADPDA
ncbi:hypothetical protein [Rhodococcus sp. BS-15]|uniref:hypothetical protein n=1 Tax=Rhodococcus sp. BS-15 TaxID=1304954 RepID=UPI000FFB4EC1|nr:hypothetical protein [Rhodococcus sp. BS-15]